MPPTLHPANGATTNDFSPILGTDGKPLPRRFAIPHEQTFAAIYNQGRKLYHFTIDEALRYSRDNAVRMENDTWLMGMLQERLLPTSQLAWSLETDDPEDPRRKATAAALTREIEDIPNFDQLKWSLLQAVWFGRYGVQVAHDWKRIGGRKVMSIVDHVPVNGDKIQFQWADGSPTGSIPTIALNGSYTNRYPRESIVYTERWPALKLDNRALRDKFLIHQHVARDPDYFDSDLAGAVLGTGLRGQVFWNHFLLMEIRSWIMDFAERVGMGLYIFKYRLGDPAAQRQAEKAGEQYSRNTVLIWGVPEGADKDANGVEKVEPPMSGAEFLLKYLQQEFEDPIQRMIIGQTLSSDHKGSGGLGGSGAAEFQQDTKNRIIKWDAGNLGQTLTRDLIRPMQYWNHRDTYPDADNERGFNVRFVFAVDDPDPKDKLDAAEKAWEMGCTIVEQEIRDTIGLSTPKPGEPVLKKADAAAPGMGAPAGPGGPPPATPAASSEQPPSLMPEAKPEPSLMPERPQDAKPDGPSQAAVAPDGQSPNPSLMPPEPPSLMPDKPAGPPSLMPHKPSLMPEASARPPKPSIMPTSPQPVRNAAQPDAWTPPSLLDPATAAKFLRFFTDPDTGLGMSPEDAQTELEALQAEERDAEPARETAHGEPVRYDKQFREEQHPRDPKGEFTSGAGDKGGGKAKADKPAAKESDAHPGAAHGSAVTVKPVKQRVFDGAPVATKSTLTKQETGRVGEAVVLAYLKTQLGCKDARPMNKGETNFPIDLIEDHRPTEVKAGLCSNARDAQKWRLTFSKESASEKALYEQMTEAERTAWNAAKQERIHQRKQAVIDDLSKKGKKVKPRTMTVIINPDTRTADVYEFDGFHDIIRWNSPEAKAAYRGSVQYDH